ncbi:hypothetical protein [Castellaniella sp. MT123]|uniref:hypothetical protein n=1 Tax=Castellaniella sp. MT123 TaxID=3140381 RepID=UPI0031F3D7F8
MRIIRKTKEAFTLIETLVVIGIMALISIGVMLQLQRNAEKTKAKNAGEKIKELGNALQSYVSNNKSALLAAIASGDTKTLDICILTNAVDCVPDGVPVEEVLPQTFTNDSLLQTGYKIALKNVDNKSIEGLVFTDGPVVVGDNEPRYDLLGIATKEAGNTVGFSDDTGTQINGLNGGWAIQNIDLPYGGEAGILAYRTNGINDYDGSYLRRDGSNEMTGDLLLGNNNIKNVNSLTVDTYVASQSAYFQNMRTQTIYNSGDLYTDSMNSEIIYSGSVNTNEMNSAPGLTNRDIVVGADFVNKATAPGSIYAKAISANTQIDAQTLLPNKVVSKNAACGAGVTNGTIAKDADGKILSCQSGIWKQMTLDMSGLEGLCGQNRSGAIYWYANGSTWNVFSHYTGGCSGWNYYNQYHCSDSTVSYLGQNKSWDDSCVYEPGCCFPLNSLVLMANGSLKAIQEIVVGDMVMGIEGRPTRVKKTLKPILGDRRVLAFKDGTHIWSEEHGHWVRNRKTGKEWPWSANVARWISEMEEEMGGVGDFSKKYQGGLKDIYGISDCPIEDIEFAGLDGFAGKEIYEIEGLSYDTPLFSPSTEDGQAIIVNGYVVGGNWNEYVTDYHQTSWENGRQKILSDLGIDPEWLIFEVRKSMDKTKTEFKFKADRLAA